MSWIAEINSWWIVQVGGLIGFGMMIDALTPTKTRDAISQKLALRDFASQHEFECLMITNLVDLFQNAKGKISLWRVFCISLLGAFLVFLFTAFYTSSFSILVAPDYAFALFLAALIACPFDMYSVGVTKRIFYYRYHKTRFVIFRLLQDIFLSTLPIFIIVIVMIIIGPQFNNKIFNIIFVSTVCNLVSSVVINAFQSLAIVGGLAVKVLAMVDILYDGGLEYLARFPMALTLGVASLTIAAGESAYSVLQAL